VEGTWLEVSTGSGRKFLMDGICGKNHPYLTDVVCTKPRGHDSKHGRPDVYRSVLWDMRPNGK